MTKPGWTQKGGALSDKSARKEFGLTQDEIVDAINNGKLQYKMNHIHGNPYFRLLRSEVEALVVENHGREHLNKKRVEHELSLVNKEIRSLKRKLKTLEKKKIELVETINGII